VAQRAVDPIDKGKHPGKELLGKIIADLGNGRLVVPDTELVANLGQQPHFLLQERDLAWIGAFGRRRD
jgi:hypothetical protein